jgi:hypothetical protein
MSDVRLRAGALGLALLFVSTAAASAPSIVAPSAPSLAADLARLAAPEMEGRGSATRGGERAARLIERWLASSGLRPGGDGGTFLQWFTVSTAARLGTASALEIPGQRFAAERDWIPHGGSREADVRGAVVFAGYGISAPASGYDDYAGVSVDGAVVVVLDGAPPHLGGPAPSRPAKLLAALERGARAVVVVAETLPPVDATPSAVALVSATATPAVADALLAPSGVSVAHLARAIAETRAPASRPTPATARVRVDLARAEERTANVVGILPGTDPALAGEAVVVGAHYDHLGVVGGAVHTGADDNASGTAVVTGLARAFAAAGGTPRTLVFALFSGEEMGLLGSRHYVRDPAVPVARTVAMVNLDMVGRLRDHRLMVGGVDSSSGFRATVQDAARGLGLDLSLRGSPFGPSDHSTFYRAGVPVLFFHTGRHDDYHRPSDTADRINTDGLARVATVAARVVERLAGGGPRPLYAKVDPPARARDAVDPDRAFLGVAADPRGRDGVRLSSVVAGSAAARAGLRAGDVIVDVGGVGVSALDDLRAVLDRRRPGDGIHLVFLRDGRGHAASATLDARPDDAR